MPRQMRAILSCVGFGAHRRRARDADFMPICTDELTIDAGLLLDGGLSCEFSKSQQSGSGPVSASSLHLNRRQLLASPLELLNVSYVGENSQRWNGSEWWFSCRRPHAIAR